MFSEHSLGSPFGSDQCWSLHSRDNVRCRHVFLFGWCRVEGAGEECSSWLSEVSNTAVPMVIRIYLRGFSVVLRNAARIYAAVCVENVCSLMLLLFSLSLSLRTFCCTSPEILIGTRHGVECRSHFHETCEYYCSLGQSNWSLSKSRVAR